MEERKNAFFKIMGRTRNAFAIVQLKFMGLLCVHKIWKKYNYAQSIRVQRTMCHKTIEKREKAKRLTLPMALWWWTTPGKLMTVWKVECVEIERGTFPQRVMSEKNVNFRS
jgi:hypothetical protein